MSELTQDDLLVVFTAECEENLSTLEQLLVLLESAPNDQEIVDTIFRCAHTLKGNSASLGFDAPARVAHAMEDLLDRVRAGRVAITPRCVSLLLAATDALRRLLLRSVAGQDLLDAPSEQLIAALALDESEAPHAVATNAAPATVVEPAAVEPSRTALRRVRVDLPKLDRLLNTTAELVIASGRARAVADALPAGPQREAMAECLEEMERLFSAMQEQVTRVRMVPVGGTFEQLKRTLRDASQNAAKDVRLVIQGSDVEIDASVIEHVKDPLTHMIRNAVDHGIESAGRRAAAGKDPRGTIVLRARHDGAAIVIEIADDGAGLDPARILARARERGLIAASEDPGEQETLRMIFLPGFTTAEQVSELSGRGVGMDVVHRNVTALRGTIDIDTAQGRGTIFTIRLPLTLAILDGLAVEAGGERFVLPIQSVEECVELPASAAGDQASGVIEFRGTPLPYVRIARFYELGNGDGARENVVVVRSGRHVFGLVTNALLGEIKALIKPVGKLFRDVAGVTGSTLFGDGRVGLILDVSALARETARRQGGVGRESRH